MDLVFSIVGLALCFVGYIVKSLFEIVYDLITYKAGEKKRDEEFAYWNKVRAELNKAYSKSLDDYWRSRPEETQELALKILEEELKIDIVEMYDSRKYLNPKYVLDEMLARRIVVAAKGGCIIEEDLDSHVIIRGMNYGRFTKTVYRHDKYYETYEHFKARYDAQRRLMIWVEHKVKEAHPHLETLEMVFLEDSPSYTHPRRYMNINTYATYDVTASGEYLWMPTARYLTDTTCRVSTWY